MRLLRHKDTPSGAEFLVDAAVRRTASHMRFEFAVKGDIDRLRLAPASAPLRTDVLWATTCFEAFAQTPGAKAYREFNFAPSTHWAAYAFTGYREGMAPLAMEPPRIVISKTRAHLALAVEIESRALPEGPLRIALTAVIEEADGVKSYWSLAHADGKPDFHAEAGFVYEVWP